MLIFNSLTIALPARGDSPPRITWRGGSLRVQFLSQETRGWSKLGHRRRSIRRAAAAGGSGRALKARPDPRLPGSGQDRAFIRTEGLAAKGVRAG